MYLPNRSDIIEEAMARENQLNFQEESLLLLTLNMRIENKPNSHIYVIKG